MKTKKLPEIDSIEALAKFWDTHDLTDFEGELEVVAGPVFERQSETLMTVPFRPDEAAAIRRIAEGKGIKQSELIREWVVERLHQAS